MSEERLRDVNEAIADCLQHVGVLDDAQAKAFVERWQELEEENMRVWNKAGERRRQSRSRFSRWLTG